MTIHDDILRLLDQAGEQARQIGEIDLVLKLGVISTLIQASSIGDPASAPAQPRNPSVHCRVLCLAPFSLRIDDQVNELTAARSDGWQVIDTHLFMSEGMPVYFMYLEKLI